MVSLDTARDLVNKALATLGMNKDPHELYDPIRYVISIGGKRLRPSMVIMACSMFSEKFDEAINPALAIELFHNFTLLHDDIMDDSPLRRGKPTVHREWNQNAAILSGDAMVFLAYEQLAQTRNDVIAKLIQIFNKTAMEVCEGQQYDMNFESKLDVTESEYLKMIELKTAVLMGASLKIGAIIGGATTENADLMYSFGKNLGLAFQLQDDLLDVYGDPEIFGKKIGGDIVAGKKTYLLVKTLDLADEELKIITREVMNNTKLQREEKVRLVRTVYDQVGVKDHLERKVNEYFLKANEALKDIQVDRQQKEELFILAKSLMHRER